VCGLQEQLQAASYNAQYGGVDVNSTVRADVQTEREADVGMNMYLRGKCAPLRAPVAEIVIGAIDPWRQPIQAPARVALTLAALPAQ
jgi:hypothetical protein